MSSRYPKLQVKNTSICSFLIAVLCAVFLREADTYGCPDADTETIACFRPPAGRSTPLIVDKPNAVTMHVKTLASAFPSETRFGYPLLSLRYPLARERRRDKNTCSLDPSVMAWSEDNAHGGVGAVVGLDDIVQELLAVGQIILEVGDAAARISDNELGFSTAINLVPRG